MTQQLSVLLYSKYSPNSTRLMTTIEKSGVDFSFLESLCIDSEKIRTRLVENTQIPITLVPCILVIFPDGGIEKYDGMSVFQWVENIIKESRVEQSQVESRVQESPKQESPNQESRVQESRVQESQNQPDIFSLPTTNQETSKGIKFTNIDDLPELEDESEEKNIKSHIRDSSLYERAKEIEAERI